METYKRFVVMYQKDVPQSLIDYVGADRNFNITKDGLQEYEGVRAFRCLVAVAWRNSFEDHTRLAKLERFLIALQEQGLILSYRKI